MKTRFGRHSFIAPTTPFYNRVIVIRVQVVASSPALNAGLRALLSDDEIALVDGDADVFVLSGDVSAVAALVREDHSQALVQMATDLRTTAAIRALPLKGWGVVFPDVSSDELRASVRAVALGLTVIPNALANEVLARATETQLTAELEQPLTQRELEVLERVGRGLPSKLIALELDVSESTVKFHLSSIYSKLGAASRTDAVSRAAKLGLITL